MVNILEMVNMEVTNYQQIYTKENYLYEVYETMHNVTYMVEKLVMEI